MIGAENDKAGLVLTCLEVPNLLCSIFGARAGLGGRGCGIALGAYQVAVGDSTNVAATADMWYRIGTLATNGVSVPAAAGAQTYTAGITAGAAARPPRWR